MPVDTPLRCQSLDAGRLPSGPLPLQHLPKIDSKVPLTILRREMLARTERNVGEMCNEYIKLAQLNTLQLYPAMLQGYKFIHVASFLSQIIELTPADSKDRRDDLTGVDIWKQSSPA